MQNDFNVVYKQHFQNIQGESTVQHDTDFHITYIVRQNDDDFDNIPTENDGHSVVEDTLTKDQRVEGDVDTQIIKDGKYREWIGGRD